MYYGIEARSPFLDQRLWEFASGLSFKTRLHNFRLKAVLREIARRRISKELSEGKKRGFGIPVHRWLVGTWRPLVEHYVCESLLEKQGWIQPKAAMKIFRDALSNGVASLPLWYLVVLESWMRNECNQFSS
jgi:asparagine synthase (glutamine-hydrolysing)